MQNRQRHQQEVLTFLQRSISNQSWEFNLPGGWGNETYIAHSSAQDLFIKLGAQVQRYEIVAVMSLTPPVLASGILGDGTSIMVQPYLPGKRPSRSDYRSRLEQFAGAIDKVHNSLELKQTLPPVASDCTCDRGMEALTHLRQKWEHYKPQVPAVAGFIDESLDGLERQVRAFSGTGLVASHNDMNNYNWLITEDGQLYLLDLDSMSLDDPALDIGATLWWYYPPALRNMFLEISGYLDDAEFSRRMQVRMAMHCLNIMLPREDSFDQFDPVEFIEDLVDFKAIVAGEENPQGYEG